MRNPFARRKPSYGALASRIADLEHRLEEFEVSLDGLADRVDDVENESAEWSNLEWRVDEVAGWLDEDRVQDVEAVVKNLRDDVSDLTKRLAALTEDADA